MHPLSSHKRLRDSPRFLIRPPHVVERFTKLEDGNVLYQFTVEDETVWTAPYTGEYIWRASEERVYEYACHEGNYSMGNILRGARLLESESPGRTGSTGNE